MKKKWLLSLLAASACIAGTFGLTACDEVETGHKHDWSAWSVTEAPTATAAGKATRTCSGSGDCDAVATDKEYTLPDLTSADYTLTDDTATCEAAGTATYAYNKSGVAVSFTAATNAIGHAYGTAYTYEDATGHWQVCANNPAHTTEKEEHDEDGTDGACSKCGYTAPTPEHKHAWGDWTVTDENVPTAESTGKATRTCNNADCDAEADDKEYTLPDLTSADYTLTGDTATCEAAGTATYTYNKNNVAVSFTAATSAIGHDYGTAYTYEDETGHWQVCANNAAHITEKEEHDEDGTDGACSKCGYTAPQHEHDWSAWSVTEAPTATATGKATRTCNNADCDAEADDKEYTLPDLTSADYTLTGDTATCEAAGTATYTYNKNNVAVSFTAATNAIGHDWSWVVADENKPTADETGKATRICKNTNCDANESAEECELPTLMSEDYSKSMDNATCEEAGTATFTYNKDGVSVSFTAETPATGHTERVIAGKATTCYDDGLTDGKECSICRKVLEEQKVIVTTGHKFDDTYAPVLDETNNKVSQRCGACNTTVVYECDNAVLNASSSSVSSPSTLTAGVNYVSQDTTNPYLGYTFEEAGTYTVYWMSLNNSTFNVSTATFGSTSKAFINSSKTLVKANIPEGFAIEGYATSTLQYYVTDEEGNQTSTTAQAGDYVRLTKDSFLSSQSQIGLGSFVPVKITFTVEANATFKFRTVTSSTGGCFLIGINEEPTVSEEYCKVAAGDFAIKNNELEFTAATEEETYTFTATVGEFELYVNDTLYSEGSKTRFGYVDFNYRYFTVNLQVGDVVTVKQVAGRASENVITIYDGEEQEPAESEYKVLQLGEQTITLSDTNIAVGKYEVEEEQFYSFTSAEGGYFNISVAEGVTVNAVIRADKTHYSTIFSAPRTSGVFYVAAGEMVIIAFTGNGLSEFDVNIVSCEKPVTYLEVNEKLENITFDNFETIIELTVGESVAEGTYQLTFEFISNNLRKGVYVYFSVNEEIVVDDRFDSNAITNKYINPDLEEGAHHTVGDGISKVDIREDEETYYAENFVRTVTVKAGDVIYLATSTFTSGDIAVTLTPVAE